MTHPRVVVDATAIPARLTGAGCTQPGSWPSWPGATTWRWGLLRPGTAAALATAIAKLATDPAARADAATRGLARAASFTWERCAELTAAAYSRALDDPARASSARPRGDSR